MHDRTDHGLEEERVWLQLAPAMAPRLPQLDTTLLTIVLVLLCGNLPAVLVHTIAGLKSLPVWPVYLALYGAIGLLLLPRAAQAAQISTLSAPVISMSLLPLASALWSVAPVETTVQAFTLAGTALTGFFLAACVPTSQALRVIAQVASLAACLDLLTIVALPSVGIEQDGPWVGTWRGLHDQKNGLGAYCALQAVLILAYTRSAGRLEAFAVMGLLVNLFLFVAAKSTTSWLTAAICIPLILAPRVLQWLAGRVLPLAAAAFGIALLLDPDIGGSLLSALPGLVGKDSTLSNRLPVWAVLAPYLELAPWFGYGYGAFWSEAIMPGDVFLSQIKFLPGSAHSSIVELRLGLGFLGLGLMAVTMAHYVRCLWRCDHPAADGEARLIAPLGLAYFAYLLFQSMTESLLLTRNDLMWALFVWLAVRLAFAGRLASS